MNSHIMSRTSRGFSMIEVLIAVVVLGFGLMALAALQTSIIRSSAETKAQTVALQLAKDKVEDLRSFQHLAGYQALTSGNDTATESAVTYARTWTVTRFGYQPSAGVFTAIATLTGATPAADAGGIAFSANNEYKRVAVRVSWTDAGGVSQSIAIEDAIGAVSPGDGAKVVLNNTASSEPRYPRVLIRDPSLTPGVIPIAIGNGTDTAATNPRPEVAGNNNNQRVVETRYDVLTYAGLNNGVAQAQSRVETVVVGCTCTTNNPGTDVSYRPTYWNGFRYTVPRVATYTNPKARAATLAQDAPPQSQYCNTCCRDHHDPSGEAGPKFDPRRTSHVHYKIVNGALQVAGADDDYIEACRLIRVDGIFRVATDLSNDYFNLLRARNDGTAAAYAPTSTAASNYESLVLDYLGSRIVNEGNATRYNMLLNAGALAALEFAWDINNPSEIPIQLGNDFKWLHSRGLFIDYLEPEAVDKITTIKADCKTSLQSCVLPFVPFTSINLSELSNWTPVSGPDIAVTNNDFSGGGSGAPVRGKVTPGSRPVKATETANSTIYASNSGVAVLQLPIDNEEILATDSQLFRIGGSDPGGSGSFKVNITGYSFGIASSGNPVISTQYSFTDCNPSPSTVNPYNCTVSKVGLETTVSIGKYNYPDTTLARRAGFSGNITCTKTQAGSTESKTISVSIAPGTANARPICRNFGPAMVNSGFTSLVLGHGTGLETTRFTGIVNQDDVLQIAVTEEAAVPATEYICTFTKNANEVNDIADVSLTWDQDPCN